jgi:hypothetical protein
MGGGATRFSAELVCVPDFDFLIKIALAQK